MLGGAFGVTQHARRSWTRANAACRGTRLRSRRMASRGQGGGDASSERTSGCVRKGAEVGNAAIGRQAAQLADEERGEHERDRGQELDEDVERGAGRDLER